MTNIIVPVVEKPEEFRDFVLKNSNDQTRFFLGIHEKFTSLFEGVFDGKNVEIHVFSDSSNKEEIINSLHSCTMEKGKIMIVRRVLKDREFERLTNSDADITTLVGRHGKIFNFFKSLAVGIVKRFFSFSFFEDISAIIYGQEMFELISVCPNISIASRVNRYVGVEEQQIETSEKPVPKQYSKPKAISLFFLWTILLLGSIAGGILVCLFTNYTAITVLLVVLWLVVALLAWSGGMINFSRTIVVGNLHYGRVAEIGTILIAPKTTPKIVPETTSENGEEKQAEEEEQKPSTTAKKQTNSKNSKARSSISKSSGGKTAGSYKSKAKANGAANDGEETKTAGGKTNKSKKQSSTKAADNAEKSKNANSANSNASLNNTKNSTKKENKTNSAEKTGGTDGTKKTNSTKTTKNNGEEL